MQSPHNEYEPTPDHLADTNPMRAITDTDLHPAYEARGGRSVIGVLSLLGAFGFMVATALLLTSTPAEVAMPGPTTVVLAASPEAGIGAVSTDPTMTILAPTLPPNPSGETVLASAVLPIADPSMLQQLLQQPLVASASASDLRFARNLYDPFTIIPDRPRNGPIQYEVVSGDTMYTIAERFSLKPESIAWSNDRSIIGGLRPGRMINIPPVDGVMYTVPNQATVGEIAAQFSVDAYAIIDSPFNQLYDVTEETPLPSGTTVMIPGGQAEQISWNPTVERVEGGGGGGGGGQISFSPGDPGSCGLVPNPGGGGGWLNPLGAGSYQWMRGFSSWHTGVDLAKPEGSPVLAANGGTVVFAGWNSFGYGYAIVLASGPFTTLYGHLSAINVGCAQSIGAGQVIGAVGTTGNSSGPHLHFEIRYNDVPQDPTTVMPL